MPSSKQELCNRRKPLEAVHDEIFSPPQAANSIMKSKTIWKVESVSVQPGFKR